MEWNAIYQSFLSYELQLVPPSIAHLSIKRFSIGSTPPIIKAVQVKSYSGKGTHVRKGSSSSSQPGSWVLPHANKKSTTSINKNGISTGNTKKNIFDFDIFRLFNSTYQQVNFFIFYHFITASFRYFQSTHTSFDSNIILKIFSKDDGNET